jgi:predicted AAA+ superfamily ATPase
MISRQVHHELLVSAREYPAVTILGPRQSGKTTLAQMAFPDYTYYSLEDPDVRKQASDDPRGLLARISGGVILDEIQRVPSLLSYLQGVIDRNPQAGQFILTGSHQPHVQQAITQSLAGRTAILELLPFSIEELKQYDRPPLSAFEMILRGFYPRIHQDQLRPNRFFGSYLSTYIERDLRAMINLQDLTRFEQFLRLLAGRVGQLVNYSSLANDIGVSSTTIKNWISVLKASFILFELPPYFSNIRKRIIKSSKLYFIDVGLAAWLLGLQTPQHVERDPLRGNLYENLLIIEVLKKMLNQGAQPTLYFYRDAKGNEVDLLIAGPRTFSAIEIKSAETFQPEFVNGIEQFTKTFSNSAAIHGTVWYNGDRQTTYQSTNVCNPLMHGLSW